MKNVHVIVVLVCVAISHNLFSTPRKLAAPTHDERQKLYKNKFNQRPQIDIQCDALHCIQLLLLAGAGHCAATIPYQRQEPIMDENLVSQLAKNYKNYAASKFNNNQKQKSKILKNPRHR